jgi:hypothetical protein
MALLTKEQILGADDRTFEVVDVPEWGGQVRVAVWSGLQRDRFDLEIVRRRKEAQSDESAGHFRALVVACSLVDEAGHPLGWTPEDIERLSVERSAKPLTRIFRVADKLNAITSAEKEKISGE